MVERLGQLGGVVVGLEGDQQMAAGREHAVELGEYRGEPLGRGVDDRVAGENPGEGGVLHLEGVHQPHLEAEFRMGVAGECDRLR